MPLLPFEFEEKGVVEAAEFVVPYANPLVHFQDLVSKKRRCLINTEPNSVLDYITTSPSPPSSLAGADVASKWPPPENQENLDLHHFQQQPSLVEKCAGMDGWDNTDSGQDQAMLRWIMGDVEDPSIGLNKILHSGGAPADFEFTGGFASLDQGFISLDSGNLPPNPELQTSLAPAMYHHHQNQTFSPLNETQLLPFDVKPNLFNTQVPFQHLMQPQPKRYNPGSVEYNTSMDKNPFLDSGPNPNPNPLQLLQKSSSMKKITPINQGIIDQLFKAADLIQSRDIGAAQSSAQEILARLNHQLSPIGKPFERAAFYFKEALQLLTHSVIHNINPQMTQNCSPFSLIFKIGAYKSFSEISPFVQFANFTCNQALLESLNGFDQIHILDFDIGYGCQWASVIQELSLRNNGVLSLKITAFASSSHDQIELGLTRENLTHFANGFNIGFEFEIINIDFLAANSWSFQVSENEAIAVNLPAHVLSNHQTQIASMLRFVKNLSPKIVVSVDRGFDRTDLSFPNHLIHALQSYSNLLESLESVNLNLDSLQKIERFLIQPAIEKIVSGRYLSPEKTQPWRNVFVSAGFSPLMFSNFTESQAECLVKRSPVREFHVEKRQSALVLCWQRRELVSVSAWRCC